MHNLLQQDATSLGKFWFWGRYKWQYMQAYDNIKWFCISLHMESSTFDNKLH